MPDSRRGAPLPGTAPLENSHYTENSACHSGKASGNGGNVASVGPVSNQDETDSLIAHFGGRRSTTNADRVGTIRAILDAFPDDEDDDHGEEWPDGIYTADRADITGDVSGFPTAITPLRYDGRFMRADITVRYTPNWWETHQTAVVIGEMAVEILRDHIGQTIIARFGQSHIPGKPQSARLAITQALARREAA